MITDSKRLMVLFALVVVASGCAGNSTNTDTETSISPISVNSFSAIPNPVPSGQTANINMELENTGDADAESLAVRLFGPTFGESGDRVWKSATSNVDMSRVGPRTKFIEDLRAPSESNPSIPKQVRWSLTAPSLAQSREINYNFYADIFYQYETTASTDFKLVSGQRFRDQGMTQTDADTENSDGPIQIDIRGTTPKIYYEGESIESEICITVTNEGSGKAFTGGAVTGTERKYNMNEANENTVELSIQDVGNVQFEPVESGDTVKLVGGNEGFKCYEMTASGLTNSEQNINTQITAEYNYVKETQTSVTVEGRRGSGTGDEETNPSDDETDYSWSDEAPASVKNNEDAQSYCTDSSQPDDLRDEYCEPNP
jgi:hypothetical protein